MTGPFDLRASDYARARPTYPSALFDALAAVAPARRLAWDCGTGSGQAASGLGGRFDRVIGSDISVAQLGRTTSSAGLAYVQADAAAAPLPSGVVDLVTVAAAIHWFDLPRFYAEVRRVLAPGGVIAVFSYFATRAAPELQAVIDRYADEVIASYWDERVDLPRNHYRGLRFPFEAVELDGSPFEAVHRIDLDRLVAFIRSWSASQAYERDTGKDPLAQIRDQLEGAWGDPAATRELRWPLFVRCGRIPRP